MYLNVTNTNLLPVHAFKDTKVFNTNKMIYSLNKNIKLQGVDGLQTSFSTNSTIIVLSVQQNEEILD